MLLHSPGQRWSSRMQLASTWGKQVQVLTHRCFVHKVHQVQKHCWVEATSSRQGSMSFQDMSQLAWRTDGISVGCRLSNLSNSDPFCWVNSLANSDCWWETVRGLFRWGELANVFESPVITWQHGWASATWRNGLYVKISARWTGNTPGNHSLIFIAKWSFYIFTFLQYHLYISLYIFITCCAFDIANHSNLTEDLPLQWSTERLRGSAWFSCWNKKLWSRPLQKEFHRLGQHWNSRYSGHRPPCLPMPRMPRRCQKVGCQQISASHSFPVNFTTFTVL